MTTPKRTAHRRSIFRDDEPVVQSQPLLVEVAQRAVKVPLFGDTDVWDFNGVARRNANLPECGWKIVFSQELALPEWNLTAREIAMIMVNPRHEAVTDVGVHLQAEPYDLATVIGAQSILRRVIRWARTQGLPPRLGAWSDRDLHRFVTLLREGNSAPGTVMNYINMIKRIHHLGPALSVGGFTIDPWHGMSARKAAKYLATEVSTPVIPPDIWFPLVRAAWVYVHTFAPDVLRAIQRHGELSARARNPGWGSEAVVTVWLADPAHRVPLRPPTTPGGRSQDVHWGLLALELGFTPHGSIFLTSTAVGRRRRARVIEAVRAGHPTSTGLIHDLAQVKRSDGSTGPWHPELDSAAALGLVTKLRDAAFCLVAALSMMRDSEIHEIRRGSVVEHYNAPAIASTLDKRRPGKPGKHWWITEPVAEAIALAEIVSVHQDRVFAPLKRPDSSEAVHGDQMLDSFITTVNTNRGHTGLDEIPEGRTTPHMFRRTMSMLTDQFPGSEIALGLQLKHVATRALANRSTHSYATADVSWADHLESAIDAARFRRFTDLFGRYKDGDPIGYGPGAERVTTVFDQIQATVRARGGDARVEEDLLRKARITIRFGVLNNCLFDETSPAGAVCLENTVVPEGHVGPMDDRCRPDRCRNSMIGPEHIPIHASHRHAQLALLQTPGLPAGRKSLITREVARIDAVLAQVTKDNT